MKQVLLDLGTGEVLLAEIPAPAARAGYVVIRTVQTVVSPGTERSLLEFGRAGWVHRALTHTDKVGRVFDKIRSDGFWPALEAVQGQLAGLVALGYCNAGHVVEVGPGVTSVAVGDRVVSNGPHAEVVSVPATLVSRIPPDVSFDAAAFTVAGAIALEGIRLAQPVLGDVVAVIGLGLIGQLAVQLLAAQGCRVLGVDLDPERAAIAARSGATVAVPSAGADPVAVGLSLSQGRGVDSVLIATATASDEPLRQAARMSRQRGRVVLIGVAGTHLSRDDFYRKELSFQVSCSYGPGRHDPAYEEQGHDYPVGFVRWTAQRNFEAVLEMIAVGRVNVRPLLTRTFGIDAAIAAYRMLTGPVPVLGLLLRFREVETPSLAPLIRRLEPERQRAGRDAPAGGERPVSLGVVGAGEHVRRVLLPAFRAVGARMRIVASRGGVSAAQVARDFRFEACSTDVEEVIGRADVDAVVIATRHDSHASLVCRALTAGKDVYVEKPLALDSGQLAQVQQAYTIASRLPRPPLLCVGFNRRFARDIGELRHLAGPGAGARCFVITVNAGRVSPDHWSVNPDFGGGRLIGEGCHFVDLLMHLTGHPVRSVSVVSSRAQELGETATIQLLTADGSLGIIHYITAGHPSFPKERLEAFLPGRVIQIDNLRRVHSYGVFRWAFPWPWSMQDKGHAGTVRAFLAAVSRSRLEPVPAPESFEATHLTLAIAALARAGGGWCAWPPVGPGPAG